VTGTLTASRTNTYTDPRLRAVMPEVGADFYALAGAQIISLAVAQCWTEFCNTRPPTAFRFN
jgi:hypothetical protein